MSIITISTPFNIDLEFKIAPLHKRILAWMIDIIIMYSFVFLMLRFAVPYLRVEEYMSKMFSYLFVMIPAFSYHLILELVWNGQSVGKKALGIKVVDANGKEPTISQYLLRWVLRIVDMGMTMGFGAILAITFSSLNQRLGDLAAGTVVIDQTGKTNLKETIYMDITENINYKPMFPEVMRLTDRDINGIRNLLDTPYSKDTEIYTLQVTHRIKEVLHLQSDIEPRAFLQQLLHDYNFLTRK
jgi:uncharacterized RDD family membrane protein YckC